MRAVRSADEIADAFARCASEAQSAFGGDGSLYAERLIENAQHRNPDPRRQAWRAHAFQRARMHDPATQPETDRGRALAFLNAALRKKIVAAAMTLAKAANYDNLGTFRIPGRCAQHVGRFLFAFIEANPRLQVEHTVTEEVFDVDLVQAQIRVAAGESLADIGLAAPARAARGYAIQSRVNHSKR